MRVLTVVRLAALGFFLYHTVTVHVTFMAVLSACLLLATMYLLKEPSRLQKKTIDMKENPLKGKPLGVTLANIPEDLRRDVDNDMLKYISYDALNCQALQEFETVKQETECVFAKRAKLWGSSDWDKSLSLEGNVQRCLPTLLKFTRLCPVLGLDGFVIMLPGEEYGNNLQVFGESVRRVLTTVSTLDPAGVHCMDKSYISRRGWVFQFNKCTMFVTTFAPFYPSNHSRFAIGSKNCFILLQPELSFAQHDLCPDTPLTNWKDPQTVRDRIRVAFRDAGREYEIRDTIHYPMAEDIVKPDKPFIRYIEWWKDKEL